VDYPRRKPHLVDPTTSGITEVDLFVGVLGASNYTDAEVIRAQQVPAWLGSHECLFRFFGGLTAATAHEKWQGPT
jgi:transposase